MTKILVLILFFSFYSEAGVIKGNGGNSLVCPESTELLDVSEARLLDDAHFAFDSLEARAIQRAEKQIPPQVFQTLKTWLNSWQQDAQFLQNVSLGEVTDSFHFAVPENCSVVQTVIAREPFPGEKRYLVRSEIYQSLPVWQKTALKWHEVLYRWVISRRQTKNEDPNWIYNSESTRKMVAALYADESNNLSSSDWASILEDLN